MLRKNQLFPLEAWYTQNDITIHIILAIPLCLVHVCPCPVPTVLYAKRCLKDLLYHQISNDVCINNKIAVNYMYQ